MDVSGVDGLTEQEVHEKLYDIGKEISSVPIDDEDAMWKAFAQDIDAVVKSAEAKIEAYCNSIAYGKKTTETGVIEVARLENTGIDCDDETLKAFKEEFTKYIRIRKRFRDGTYNDDQDYDEFSDPKILLAGDLHKAGLTEMYKKCIQEDAYEF